MNKWTFNTRLVGIINLSPDSFSGDGRAIADSVQRRALSLITDGAAVIDVGAESTRPGALPITEIAEWNRLEKSLPGLAVICRQHGVILSVDTRSPITAEKAIMAGADWINDVSGLKHPRMIDIIKNSGRAVVLTHSLSVPADPDITMQDADPVAAIIAWGQERLGTLQNLGIKAEQLIFDPGIGFGKTAGQSMDIIKRAKEFKALGVPLLFGHSRKSFLKQFGANSNPAERDIETAIVSLHLARLGVDFLRVHNVAMNAKALAIGSY